MLGLAAELTIRLDLRPSADWSCEGEGRMNRGRDDDKLPGYQSRVKKAPRRRDGHSPHKRREAKDVIIAGYRLDEALRRSANLSIASIKKPIELDARGTLPARKFKRAVDEERYNEIVKDIVRALGPHDPGRSKSEIFKIVRLLINEELPKELAFFQPKLKESPVEVRDYLDELIKAVRNLETLLLRMPNRIAWIEQPSENTTLGTLDSATGLLIPIEDQSQGNLQTHGNLRRDLFSALERILERAHVAKQYCGRSKLFGAEQYLSARYARLLILSCSKKKRGLRWGKIPEVAMLIFELLTGKQGEILERACKDEVARSKPIKPLPDRDGH